MGTPEGRPEHSKTNPPRGPGATRGAVLVRPSPPGRSGGGRLLLLVVLLLVDLLALLVLRLGEPGALLLRDLAVGLGLGLHLLDLRLALLELCGFLFGELARLHALLDARFLVRLALVDARRRGLGGHGKRRSGE